MSYGILGYDELEIKSREQIWNIKANNGFLMSKKVNDSFWQEISADFDGLFAFDISAINQCHLSYKNNYEKIIYYCLEKGAVEVIDYGLEEMERIIFQRILLTDRINIISIIRNPQTEKWKIGFCFKKDDVWSSPQIIDTGWGFSPQTCAAASHNNYLYLFYQVYNKNKYQLVYTVGQDREWTPRNLISSSENLNISPAVAVEEKGNLHFVWLRWEEQKFKVMYSSRQSIKGPWIRVGLSKEQYLSSGETSCLSPIIINNCGEIQIFWQEKNQINRYLLKKRQLESYKEFSAIENCDFLVLKPDKYPGMNLTLVDIDTTALLLMREDYSTKLDDTMVNPPINSANIILKENQDAPKILAQEVQEELLNTLKSEIQTQKDTIMELEKIIYNKKDLVSNLEEKGRAQETIIKNLRESLLKIKESKEVKNLKLEEEKAELEEELLRLKQSLEAVKQTNNGLRKELTARAEEKKQLLQQIKELEEKNRKLYPSFPFRRRI